MTIPPAQPDQEERRLQRDAASAQLRAVADAVHDAIVGADADGTITLWVGGAEAIFGWTAAEAIGRPLLDLVPDSRKPRYLGIFRQFAAGEASALPGSAGAPLPIYAQRRDGSIFPAELTLSRGELDGRPFFAGVVRDVSSRDETLEELALAQERFRSAFEHAATGMTMTAPTGRYLRVNRAFCELVGRTEDDLLSMSFSDITHPEDQEADLIGVARVQLGEVDQLRREKRYLRPDGTPVWVEAVVSLVHDANGGPLHYLTQALDVTERRRNAAELERSNAELAQFAAVASHDLNEPLRIVDGFLGLLQERVAKGLDEDAQRFLAEARAGTSRMRELIDALLRYARADSGPIATGAVALEPLAREAEGALAATIWERGTRVVIEALPEVRGDGALLRQVLQNLLANAIRHAAAADPRVRVTARAVDAGWELSVADNGSGVAADVRPRAFDMFVRGRGGGTGLGLAICRRAVERHGGTIWFEDGGDGGADVRFTLPPV